MESTLCVVPLSKKEFTSWFKSAAFSGPEIDGTLSPEKFGGVDGES